MTVKCEDCGGPLAGTAEEQVARDHGFAFCQPCIKSMEAERDAYERIMRDEGFECVFDPQRGFVARPIDPAHGGQEAAES